MKIGKLDPKERLICGAAWRRGLATLAIVVLAFSIVGCSAEQNEEEADGGQATGKVVTEKKEGDYWASFVPQISMTEDGRQIQKTPLGNSPYGELYSEDWMYYNTSVLDADRRGCSSCHSMEETLKDGIHHSYMYVGKYQNESLPFSSNSTCAICHEFTYGVNAQDFYHSHMKSKVFLDMGGSCLSCHYIDTEGNYLLWDDVKYDVLSGISDVSTADVDMNVSWSQDEITPTELMFEEQKSIDDYEHNFIEPSDDVLETYSISFYGEMENSCEMTVQEMIDRFGTQDCIQANHCIINGTGESLIYQAQVKGIPVKKVMEYLALNDRANVITLVAADGYSYSLNKDILEDALFVYEMNGAPLPPSQGYPVALWLSDGLGAGSNVRYVSEFGAEYQDDETRAQNPWLSGTSGSTYIDSETGEYYNIPDIGVLTAESGQIFAADAPVHLEGYAHAFTETVTKMEFSLDGGQSWLEVPVNNMDTSRWVYWKLDVKLDPGAYVLQLRATSLMEDGMEHVNTKDVKFLFNVQ